MDAGLDGDWMLAFECRGRCKGVLLRGMMVCQRGLLVVCVRTTRAA